MAPASISDALNQLATRFGGQLLQPLDIGYDEARRVHNGLIDKRPSLIARCRNTADVVDAVNLAREHSPGGSRPRRRPQQLAAMSA
jgi:hypothetical protein